MIFSLWYAPMFTHFGHLLTEGLFHQLRADYVRMSPPAGHNATLLRELVSLVLCPQQR